VTVSESTLTPAASMSLSVILPAGKKLAATGVAPAVMSTALLANSHLISSLTVLISALVLWCELERAHHLNLIGND
jgi:hypothetical protein